MFIFNHHGVEEASPPVAALTADSSLSVVLKVILSPLCSTSFSRLCWRKSVCTSYSSTQASLKSPRWNFKPFSHGPFLVRWFSSQGSSQLGHSFVTGFVDPCIFCKCLRYPSWHWERTEVRGSFTLPPSGRQNSVSHCFLWKTTGSLSPRTTFWCYLCAKSRVGPVCSVQEVQGLSPWGHRGPQSCRCPLAHSSSVYSTTCKAMAVLFEIFLMASLKIKQNFSSLQRCFFLLKRIISQCPCCWE